MAGEKVVYIARLHWTVFMGAVLWLLLAIWMFAIGATGAGGALFLVALIAGALAYANFTGSEFAVTTRRVLVKVGVIRRQSLETLLDKVEGISVGQGVTGRLLDYGTIMVNGTGGSKSPFKLIAQPLEFRRHVQEQIEATNRKTSVTA